MNTAVEYEYKNFCTSLFKRKKIPKIGTKLTFKSFNSKSAPRNLLKIASSYTIEYCKSRV